MSPTFYLASCYQIDASAILCSSSAKPEKPTKPLQARKAGASTSSTPGEKGGDLAKEEKEETAEEDKDKEEISSAKDENEEDSDEDKKEDTGKASKNNGLQKSGKRTFSGYLQRVRVGSLLLQKDRGNPVCGSRAVRKSRQGEIQWGS